MMAARTAGTARLWRMVTFISNVSPYPIVRGAFAMYGCGIGLETYGGQNFWMVNSLG